VATRAGCGRWYRPASASPGSWLRKPARSTSSGAEFEPDIEPWRDVITRSRRGAQRDAVRAPHSVLASVSPSTSPTRTAFVEGTRVMGAQADRQQTESFARESHIHAEHPRPGPGFGCRRRAVYAQDDRGLPVSELGSSQTDRVQGEDLHRNRPIIIRRKLQVMKGFWLVRLKHKTRRAGANLEGKAGDPGR